MSDRAPLGYITERHAAEQMGVHVKTAQKRRRAGGGPPYYRLGRLYYYRADEVEAWLEGHRVVPGPPQREQPKQEPEQEWDGQKSKMASAARPSGDRTAPSTRVLRGTRTSPSRDARTAEAPGSEIDDWLARSPQSGSPSSSPPRLKLAPRVEA